MGKPKAHKVTKKTDEQKLDMLGQKVLLFTLPGENDGDADREYHVHEKIPFNKALAISRLVNSGIQEDKLMWLMLDDLVGPDAVTDLLNCDDLTLDDFKGINDKLGEILNRSNGNDTPKA